MKDTEQGGVIVQGGKALELVGEEYVEYRLVYKKNDLLSITLTLGIRIRTARSVLWSARETSWPERTSTPPRKRSLHSEI